MPPNQADAARSGEEPQRGEHPVGRRVMREVEWTPDVAGVNQHVGERGERAAARRRKSKIGRQSQDFDDLRRWPPGHLAGEPVVGPMDVPALSDHRGHEPGEARADGHCEVGANGEDVPAVAQTWRRQATLVERLQQLSDIQALRRRRREHRRIIHGLSPHLRTAWMVDAADTRLLRHCVVIPVRAQRAIQGRTQGSPLMPSTAAGPRMALDGNRARDEKGRPLIEARSLRKTFGSTLAVDDLSFRAEPGRVTGFLGPNGSGKSTTLRMALGVDRPDSGVVTVNGRQYCELRYPLREVGALLEAKAVHPSRTARDHLRWLAASNDIPRRRVEEVLELTGLASVARQRTRGFSLGMAQRLGVAAALIGDPEVFVLDEPVNGLDPEGILWIRTLMRRLADEGRTVLVSSHLMSEMALTADHILVIGRGRLIADAPVADLVATSADGSLRLVTPDATAFAEALATAGATVGREPDGALHIVGVTSQEVGELARDHRLAIYELVVERASLEEAFMALTRDSLVYAATSEPNTVAVSA
jgi:ABC-2 type transport system ATP-binding protein